ncbi:polyphosphate polymerase domain-containing protein [Adlercreutzia equolifaciens]|uniref:polyphosphate polymerase domain-containing protein n=1 Tax=Adlercreutzia equolifaciens TaxID=446660 RepID=UPI001CC3E2DF|nr:polyphosphate polymerase domain-containing protein [Adlercreutzia equolifaciens]MEE0583962.1 polyphosphate polymerase domain-containing protein [Adlercreutzia sp.]GJC74785.1 molecular chaperone [Adlercreutzia equolifaciens]
MAAYSSVFKRVEKKYRIGAAERAAVEAAAGGPMAVDAYGRTRITSLYLDTPERSMIARSVEKPLYREKLRLRAYGDAAGVALMGAFGAGPIVREPGGLPLSDGEVETRVAAGLQVPGAAAALPVFFGIKKKFKGIVYKRRLALTLPAALAFVSGLPYEQACARWPLSDAALAAAALSPVTRQIARELEVAMDRWLPLVPSMGIACDRVAWAYRPEMFQEREGDELFDSELRITFDDCLEYLDCHRFRSPWRPIIESSESVMEIKSAGPYPPWLVEVLSAERIYPASFTKYGNAYQLAAAEPRARNHRRAMRSGA